MIIELRVFFRVEHYLTIVRNFCFLCIITDVKFILITYDLMSAMSGLHKVHLHSSHMRAARTNFYHGFSLDPVFLEFRGVSLLKQSNLKFH